MKVRCNNESCELFDVELRIFTFTPVTVVDTEGVKRSTIAWPAHVECPGCSVLWETYQ